MKILLAISLVLNLVLAVLYYQERTKPPLERIVLEGKHSESMPIREKSILEPKGGKIPRGKSPKQTDEDADVDPLEVFTEEDLEVIADDMNDIRQGFHVKLGLSDDILAKKEALMQSYLKVSGPIYAKSPLPFNLSFADRRKLIDLEEKLHQDMERLYGKEKWTKYKSFVDNYNKKVLDGHIRGENSSVMMTY